MNKWELRGWLILILAGIGNVFEMRTIYGAAASMLMVVHYVEWLTDRWMK